MRAARVVTVRHAPSRRASPAPPTLILAAHGSVDPRSSAVAHALAGRIRRLRPWLDVRAAFLEQSEPYVGDVLADVARRNGSAVVVPMLLASAYHARVDIPAVIEAIRRGRPPGRRSRRGPRADHVARTDAWPKQACRPISGTSESSSWRSGSSNEAANTRTATLAPALAAGTRWAGVEVAFATGPHPTVAEAATACGDRGARRLVVAPWFLAHGRITDRVAESAAALGISMAEPLGSHNLVAATLLDRFDETQSARIAA